ncbi:MAG: HAMP domain-containing protein [Agarilytica sp.]
MIKSIKLKLWLALFITLALSLGTLLALSFVSVKQQFLNYATHQILERLAPLELAIIDVYQESLSLSAFTETPTRWSKLRDATYRKYLNEQNRALAMTASGPKDWSERESIEDQLQPNQRSFFQHIVLFDQDKNLIAGRKKEGAQYILRKLTYDDTLIAHIGYIKPQAFLRSVDKLFVEQQIETFSILTGLMIIAAIVVTAFVSRWLVKPLSLLSNSANRVAEGDFSVRVGYTADDELGKLCLNFDEMTDSLEKNETLRKQWVADISHEMRTPLSVLKAQVEAMEDGIRTPSTENLHLLHRNIDSLAHIIDDLYELSLTDLGALSLQKEPLIIEDMLTSVIENFGEKFQQKHLAIKCMFDPHQHTKIHADKNRMYQVFSNLFENTYRYTHPNGELRLQVYRQDDKAIIEFEDSSPGVPEASLARIYDRLFRVESSRNRETGGAGLGLSISKGIINVHGGNIFAEKSKLGGLKQTITLPSPPSSAG